MQMPRTTAVHAHIHEDYLDCDGNCLNDADGDGVCDEIEVAGCTNLDACNYDELATDDDGSCILIGDACDDEDDNTINDTIDETATAWVKSKTVWKKCNGRDFAPCRQRMCCA